MRTSMVEGVVDAVGRKILIFSTSRCCFYLKCVNVVFQVERLTNFPRLWRNDSICSVDWICSIEQFEIEGSFPFLDKTGQRYSLIPFNNVAFILNQRVGILGRVKSLPSLVQSSYLDLYILISALFTVENLSTMCFVALRIQMYLSLQLFALSYLLNSDKIILLEFRAPS